ncbi:MAG: hypothetical protein M3336_18340 [Chloroflexota bacterium]|nr:hypothetical protein [Chloroflexota bacterium]
MFGFLIGVAFGAAGYWAWQSFGRDLMGMGDQGETTYGGFNSTSSGTSSFGTSSSSSPLGTDAGSSSGSIGSGTTGTTGNTGTGGTGGTGATGGSSISGTSNPTL